MTSCGREITRFAVGKQAKTGRGTRKMGTTRGLKSRAGIEMAVAQKREKRGHAETRKKRSSVAPRRYCGATGTAVSN
jgi:hypothetical protein